MCAYMDQVSDFCSHLANLFSHFVPQIAADGIRTMKLRYLNRWLAHQATEIIFRERDRGIDRQRQRQRETRRHKPFPSPPSLPLYLCFSFTLIDPPYLPPPSTSLSMPPCGRMGYCCCSVFKVSGLIWDGNFEIANCNSTVPQIVELSHMPAVSGQDITPNARQKGVCASKCCKYLLHRSIVIPSQNLNLRVKKRWHLTNSDFKLFSSSMSTHYGPVSVSLCRLNKYCTTTVTICYWEVCQAQHNSQL